MPAPVEMVVTGADGVNRAADTLPARKLVAITKSDSTDLTSSNLRALYVGGAGDVAVVAIGDTAAVTLSAVAAGTVLPIAIKKVMSTNTTATLIVGLS